MAERRMFAKTIIDSDAFMDMPVSTQLLYFHLCMRADDEGFINSPRKIQRMIGCADDDLKLLNAKNFTIAFDNGVIVIKHWRIHNTLRKDRTRETVYQDEKALISLKDNEVYTMCQPSDNQVTTKCPPRIDKNRLEEIRIDEIILDEKGQPADTWQPDDLIMDGINVTQRKREIEERILETWNEYDFSSQDRG